MKMVLRSTDLISKKTNCTCSTLFFLISKEKQICTCSTHFCLSLPLFCTTTTLFMYDENVKLPSYPLFLWRNCRMCLPNILFPVFMFTFIFHCRSFSPCWPLAFLIFSPPLWIFMFFFLRNSSPLFSVTRSSSFSVIHLSVNIKYNVEKDTTLLLFFSQSPGGYVISFQIKPWVAHLSIELFYIGMPVVRTVGRAGHVTIKNIKISRLDRLPNFLTHGAPLCALRARESFAINASRRCRKLNENSFVFVRILEKGDSDAL